MLALNFSFIYSSDALILARKLGKEEMMSDITCGERAVLDARQKALKVLRANFQRVT